MEQPVKKVHVDGMQEWLLDGKLHRDGAAAMLYADGTQVWCQYGKLHREDGPAWIEAGGIQEYWLNDTELTKGSLKYRLVQEKERRKETQDGTTG